MQEHHRSINVHGSNARINIDTSDNSINLVDDESASRSNEKREWTVPELRKIDVEEITSSSDGHGHDGLGRDS
jgi:hypothetical protein